MRDYAMIYRTLCEDLRPWIRLRGPTGHAVRSQLRCFYKKLSPTGRISDSAENAAKEKFLGINSEIPGDFQWVSETDGDRAFWEYFQRYFREATDYLWGEGDSNLSCNEAWQWIGVGPGASLGSNSESFYTKLFDGDLVCTSDYVLALYRAAIVGTGFWSLAEKRRSERFGIRLVQGNKLFFVPKNVDVARTCCTEPIVNMTIQKVIGGFLESRLKRYFGISLDTQPDYNRSLCRTGSVNGSFGTIDLQSASDSISWALIKRIAPVNLMVWLTHARSPFTTLPSGEQVELKMISTMGNGFTFPLQTLLFSSAVRAVYHLHGKPCSDPKKHFGVFGDDIVVARECYDDTVRYLTKLGFKVNESKSFNSGPFRESCGHDYYEGAFVRPVYITSLETTSAVYSAINRLNRWSAQQGIDLPKTFDLLKSMVRFRPIPYQEADDAGIKVPYYVAQRAGATSNYYSKLQRVVKRRYVPVDSDDAKRLGFRDFNLDGWAAMCLGGYAQSGNQKITGQPSLKAFEDLLSVYTLRDRPGSFGSYRVVRGKVPYWDWHGPHADGVNHERWEALMMGYLG